MDLRIISFFIICICMVIGIVMSVKYSKPKKMWLLIILLLIGFIISISHLFMLLSRINPDEDTLVDTSTIETANPLEAEYELNSGLDEMESTKDYGVFHANNKTPYQELITQTVDIHTFAQNFSSNWRNIEDVMEVIGVECLRETESALYSVHKVEQGGLLYIFYSKEPWRTEIKGNGILQWFYVRERLSSSDFDYLEENVTTIQDSICQTEIEQIYLNCYRADPTYYLPDESLCAGFYLEDGILVTQYEMIGGELVLTAYYFQEGYDMITHTGGRGYPYEGRILEMDWVE